ncbi:MAG: site-specific DNA-methyltransferase [Treponemataceae bacterium]|nr:site-specific DNA-methyltransferase [Treponemataceae bacterium]
MDKLKMQSMDKVQENIRKIQALFPNAVTECADGRGGVKRCIDFDVLKQELADTLIDERELRYQFTWPDKQKSVLLANTPTNKTLRPCKEESVDFDNTQNLYIEGDNLEVLKLLQETYLGKIKMIYIDPPYNTGNDFVYNDDFSQEADEYKENSGQLDEQGNRLFQNTESNGRFHTDWLNMIYPRLRLAKDLLADNGILCVSIDYNENFNLRAILNEIFGSSNFVGEIYWESKTKSQNTLTSYNKLQPKAEMIFVYAKNGRKRFNLIQKSNKKYLLNDENGVYREHVLELMNANGIRGRESMVFPISDGISTVYPSTGKQWKLGQAQVATYIQNNDLFIRNDKVVIKMRPAYERVETTEPFWGFFGKDLGTAESAKKELTSILANHSFETVKPIEIIKRLIYHCADKTSTVLDFFSGSATTAHAVMQLNAEDGGNRKFIMVQLPEPCDEKSEAYKAGYKNICEIGKERIRRASAKIKQENGLTAQDLDTGFRVLKLDSSNMQPVYYRPEEYSQSMLDGLADNIKPDRTPLDLLFQVMLELGKPLSAKITQKVIAGKNMFNVDDGDLIACFDSDITEETVKAIAQLKPLYAVFRDSSLANDSTAANFEQIFATYSPNSVRKVL